MILSAQTIRRLCQRQGGMLAPFHERTIANGMSFGLSACGYDVRIAQGYVLPPGDFVLASTVERFDMPDFLCARVMDKSTWARRGIALQNTIIEPGWRGYLTLEITNHALWPITIVAGDPIAQIVWEMLDEPTEQPYVGKYNDQPDRPVEALLEG